jgi:hypothetical protein
MKSMKSHIQSLVALLAACVPLAHLHAQVILNPNQIQGTVSFTNINPAILSLMISPGTFGLISGDVVANSISPAPPLQASVIWEDATPTGLSSPYQITVESGNPGITYSLEANVNFNQGIGYNQDYYIFNNTNSPPVLSNGPPVTVNISECATLLDFSFVDASGVAVPISGGSITANLSPGPLQAMARSIAPGATNRYFVVRGSTNYNIVIQYQFGTNIYGDQVQFELMTNITTVCDQIMPIVCVVPGASAVGQITGNVALTGEFLLSTGGYPPYPNRTVVEAYNGPFNNARWDTVPGVNFTVSSSGPYALTNLPASAEASPAQGYSLHAEMEFRTNFQYSWFRTPGLGEGANPPVTVPAGSSANLGNMFAITPGYIDGSVLLQGPPENGATNSIFRGVQRSIQAQPSPDGIPHEIAAVAGNSASMMEVNGENQLAAGATLTAVNGECLPSLQGDFNPLNSAFEGSYEAVVGGLNSENSLWQPNVLFLSLENPDFTQELTNANLYDGNVRITDERTNAIEVVAGQHYTNNVAYCFSEVQIGFKTTAGIFFQPSINNSYGTFVGTDFQGNAANYQAFVYGTYGTPFSASSPTNSGLLRMALPQGSYTLYPYVTFIGAGGSQSVTGLQPINLTVGCQQLIQLQQCLQINNLDLPSCTANYMVPFSGSVASCTNVSLITYQVNGGAVINICANCGINPNFAAVLDLSGVAVCATNSVVVTAYDVDGNVSSITSQIQFNNVPPVVICPPTAVISCVNTNQVPVNFTVTATSNCTGPVAVICDPPSGSLFPAGTTTVTCYAVDSCGNQSSPCSFQVIVLSQMLTIQQAIIITWGCGILQSASTLNGPWSDVPGATSPYCVATSQAAQFYRTRQ